PVLCRRDACNPTCWIGCVSHPARPESLKIEQARALQARRLQSYLLDWMRLASSKVRGLEN
ncbi:MAG: hypothetical protein WC111_10245, partial [Candidatus Cloacimonadaceae bacterium]